jgi:excisionase family DNA binding protein
MFLKSEQVAETLKVTTLTLYRWRRDGKGPPAVKVGRRYLYDAEFFKAWLESQPSGSKKSPYQTAQ